MKAKNKIKVAVAMSGGVDSSVAAFLLKKQGYQVIGLTMLLLPCSKKRDSGCYGIKAVESARKVCQKLSIPHYVLNFRSQFQKRVIDYFCQEYLQGRTPNPCVVCNQYIKFGFLLKKAKEMKADYLATGHYARLRRVKIKNKKSKTKNTNKKSNIVCQLLRGKDKKKDQSYFLYRLTQKQLRYLMFPLGNLTKKEVRQIARKNKLPVAERPESQEICFVPNNDYREFLRENCLKAIKPGLILDKKNNVLGEHQGIAFYTVGQRKSLKIAAKEPLYVIKINREKNVLIVGPEKDLYQKELRVKNINWISGFAPKLPIKVKVKIRYKHPPSQAQIIYGYHFYPGVNAKHSTTEERERPVKRESHRIVVKFKKSQRAITPGQSAVFYWEDEVLGGGIII